jgi:hypothetical protein
MEILSGRRSLLALWIFVASTVVSQAQSVSTQRSLLDQYCVGCHNERTKTAGLMLDKMDITHVGEKAEIWEKVVRKLRAGMMPPSGARRPDAPTIGTFAGWLETELDRSAAAKLNPGAPTLHRLNRTEYANVIRDLLALEIDATSLLPADDSSYGFDNIASALGISPALMERYLAAAGKISRLAIGDTSIVPSEKTYAAPADLTQDSHIEGLPFGTRGGMLIRHQFPVDGEYAIAFKLSRGGTTRGEQLEVSVNGQRVRLFNIAAGAPAEDDAGGGGALQVRIPVKAGLQSIGVTFVARTTRPSKTRCSPICAA